MDFAILTDDIVNLKESEKIDKYLDLAREPIKKWNTKMTVIPMIVDLLGTILKGFKKRLVELEIGGKNQNYTDYSIAEIE